MDTASSSSRSMCLQTDRWSRWGYGGDESTLLLDMDVSRLIFFVMYRMKFIITSCAPISLHTSSAHEKSKEEE